MKYDWTLSFQVIYIPCNKFQEKVDTSSVWKAILCLYESKFGAYCFLIWSGIIPESMIIGFIKVSTAS